MAHSHCSSRRNDRNMAAHCAGQSEYSAETSRHSEAAIVRKACRDKRRRHECRGSSSPFYDCYGSRCARTSVTELQGLQGTNCCCSTGDYRQCRLLVRGMLPRSPPSPNTISYSVMCGFWGAGQLRKRDPSGAKTTISNTTSKLNPSLANARCGKVKQSRLPPIPMAGFDLIMYGRI
jgi:hypothetical protein